ncbi:hypothetical protein [Bifidobacterium magnum]|uniref:Uncharacterized protein n=1 Tax=Bifidobacterium magnum TaxID=1692 RepID=A0A087B9P1_9BIFI|nr:hypothetical protein [Bifidobacterium magnum]KFI67741.1 hypothetical protein BMAGN_1551 [Bifidobacterium magnum]
MSEREIAEPQNILPGDFVYLRKPETDVIIAFTVGTATHGNGTHCFTPKLGRTPYVTGSGKWEFMKGTRQPFNFEATVPEPPSKRIKYPPLEERQRIIFENLETMIERAKDKTLWISEIGETAKEIDQQFEQFPEDPRLAPTADRLMKAEHLLDGMLNCLREQIRTIQHLHKKGK